MSHRVSSGASVFDASTQVVIHNSAKCARSLWSTKVEEGSRPPQSSVSLPPAVFPIVADLVNGEPPPPSAPPLNVQLHQGAPGRSCRVFLQTHSSHSSPRYLVVCSILVFSFNGCRRASVHFLHIERSFFCTAMNDLQQAPVQVEDGSALFRVHLDHKIAPKI